MSEQYYYLLDGQEHGPFSRVAIESLLQSGKLGNAFLRQTPDQPWQAAEEMGLAGDRPPDAHSPAPASSDPAALVFRSRREIERAVSRGIGGPVLAIGLFAVLIGGGAWLAKHYQSTAASGAAQSSPDDGRGNVVGVAAKESDSPAVSTYRSDGKGGVIARDTATGSERRISTGSARTSDEPASQSDLSQLEGCDYVVAEVMGEKPTPSLEYVGGNTGMQQACAATYDSYVYRLRLSCENSMRIVRGLESRGMPPYIVQREKERQLEKWYLLRGEYEMRSPSYCR
jgi:hypothetical protein